VGAGDIADHQASADTGRSVMGDGDQFNLEALRLPDEVAALVRSTSTSRRHRRQQFVKVPWTWVERLKTTSYASTYRVALHLLHRNWRTGEKVIALSNVALASEGVSRKEKWRALAELERVELVRVERRPRKSPLVALRYET
jgi:hypothetical protein